MAGKMARSDYSDWSTVFRVFFSRSHNIMVSGADLWINHLPIFGRPLYFEQTLFSLHFFDILKLILFSGANECATGN